MSSISFPSISAARDLSVGRPDVPQALIDEAVQSLMKQTDELFPDHPIYDITHLRKGGFLCAEFNGTEDKARYRSRFRYKLKHFDPKNPICQLLSLLTNAFPRLKFADVRLEKGHVYSDITHWHVDGGVRPNYIVNFSSMPSWCTRILTMEKASEILGVPIFLVTDNLDDLNLSNQWSKVPNLDEASECAELGSFYKATSIPHRSPNLKDLEHPPGEDDYRLFIQFEH